MQTTVFILGHPYVFLCLQSSDRPKIFEICKAKYKKLSMYVNNMLIQVGFVLWPKIMIIFVRNMSKKIHQYHYGIISQPNLCSLDTDACKPVALCFNITFTLQSNKFMIKKNTIRKDKVTYQKK